MLRQIGMACVLVLLFNACTKEASTTPNFVYKSAENQKFALKLKGKDYTYDEVFADVKADIYDLEKKLFDLKMGKIKAYLLEKYIAADPKSRGMSQERFIDKVIAKGNGPTEKEVDELIKERNVPKNEQTPEFRQRVKNYLALQKKKAVVEAWLAEKTKKSPVEIYIPKPERPYFDVKLGKNVASYGNDNAKVTIVEYSDFQCPFCAKAAEVVDEIKKKYGNKVRIIFKQFPLPFHSQAKNAAMASLCAKEQDMKYFWKFHDYMFANQSKLSPKELIDQAVKFGLKKQDFSTCLTSKKYLPQVEREMEEGKSVYVKSTPTFFVNGRLVRGAQPLETFAELIEKYL